MCKCKGARGWKVSVGEDLCHPWAFGNGNTEQIQHEVSQGQVRNLKPLRASGAGHWDSNSPNVSPPRSGHRTKLCLYSFLSCLALAHPTMVGTLPKGAMPSGRARSWGLGSQSKLGRLWESPQGVRATQALTARPNRKGGPLEERPRAASRPWWGGSFLEASSKCGLCHGVTNMNF